MSKYNDILNNKIFMKHSIIMLVALSAMSLFSKNNGIWLIYIAEKQIGEKGLLDYRISGKLRDNQ